MKKTTGIVLTLMIAVAAFAQIPVYVPAKRVTGAKQTDISLKALLSAQTSDKKLTDNTEIEAVYQDKAAKKAVKIYDGEVLQTYSKTLADGSIVVGFFNRNKTKMTGKVTWEQLNISGKQTIRDLWQQQDVAVTDGQFEAEVPAHGVVLVSLKPQRLMLYNK